MSEHCQCSPEEVISGHREDCPLNKELAPVPVAVRKPFEEMTRDEMIVAHAALRKTVAEYVSELHAVERDNVRLKDERILALASLPENSPARHPEVTGCSLADDVRDLVHLASKQRVDCAAMLDRYEEILAGLGCRDSCMGWVNETAEGLRGKLAAAQATIAELNASIEKLQEEQRQDVGTNEALTFRITALEAEKAGLAAFKAYVHKRLDDAGVPVDPESSHKAEDCRIGGRLDVLFAEKAGLEKERDDLGARLATCPIVVTCTADSWTIYDPNGDRGEDFEGPKAEAQAIAQASLWSEVTGQTVVFSKAERDTLRTQLREMESAMEFLHLSFNRLEDARQHVLAHPEASGTYLNELCQMESANQAAAKLLKLTQPDLPASKGEEVRKSHAAIAAHNTGLAGMPQGPCQCEVCKPTQQEGA